MMDELQRLSRSWPTDGPSSAASASRTTGERLLTLELTQGHHAREIGQLSQEVTRLRDLQRDEAQAKATAANVKAEIREARRNMVSVLALVVSATMLAIAMTRFVADYRSPASPASAITAPAHR